MEDRFDRLEQKLDQKFAEVDQKFTGLDQKFTGLDQRFTGLDQKFTGLDQKFTGLDQKFTGLEQRFTGLEQNVAGLDQRFGGMEQKFDSLAAQLAVQGTRLENVERVTRTTATRVDAVSLQIAGVSKRVDSLTKHQKRFATDVTTRLKKAEAKAQITIEGHEAIRFEMRREFTKLRGEIHNRVQPIEVAVRKNR